MPDIDRTADIKVIAGQGAVNAEMRIRPIRGKPDCTGITRTVAARSITWR